MAFKMKGFSGFRNREERKIHKAKKKILKAGKGGPGFLDESTGKWVDDGWKTTRKDKAAARKLKKAGYTDEQIEEATGAGGWKAAMQWAIDAAKGPKVTKKNKK